MSGRGVGRNVPLKSDNSLVATYKYDAAGNRVEKAVNGGATERYVLSRAEQTSNGIDCWHVIATFDGSNNWKQNFVYRDEIDGIVMLEQKDVLDFDTDGNTTEITRNFYHGNALGSVMAISDMTQATAVSYRYDPYGKVTITRGGQTQTSDPLGQHWGFTGRFLDEETGLWYYRARYYDPETGRFLSRDWLGYLEGPNLFEYVGGRPPNTTDATGAGPNDDKQKDLAKDAPVYVTAVVVEELVREAAEEYLLKKLERKLLVKGLSLAVGCAAGIGWVLLAWELIDIAHELGAANSETPPDPPPPSEPAPEGMAPPAVPFPVGCTGMQNCNGGTSEKIVGTKAHEETRKKLDS